MNYIKAICEGAGLGLIAVAIAWLIFNADSFQGLVLISLGLILIKE